MSKRLNPNNIGFFFNKVSRNEPDIITALPPNSPTSTDENTTSSSPTNIMITLSTASSSSTNLNPSCSTNQELPMAERAAISELPTITSFQDIGLAVDTPNLTRQQRYQFLKTKWKAPEGFSWPSTERMDKGKLRKKYLGSQHFEGRFDTFSYSESKQGIFCKTCVLFNTLESVRGSKINRLVKKPLKKYAHLTGKDGYLTQHLKNKFHEYSVQAATDFLKTIESGSDISSLLNQEAARQRINNRNCLKRILQAIEFHGRLGLALRGHRDSGELLIEESLLGNLNYEQGNFRAFLQLMINSGDKTLHDHLKNSPRNGQYISSLTQNHLIDAISTHMPTQFGEEVRQARYFSLLADETTDSSHKEQLCICLRYLYKDKLVERFLCFAEADDLTGSGLAKQLLKTLQEFEIDKNNMVGQGYDGASAMSGIRNGVQKHIREVCPCAVYIHCASHCLNLCLMKACQVPQVKASVTLMNDIAVFFIDSPKRLLILQQAISECCPESSRSRLKSHCSTRWVEKQDAVFVFREIFPAICQALENIESSGGNSAGKATITLRAMDGAFLLTVEMLHVVLKVRAKLSENSFCTLLQPAKIA